MENLNEILAGCASSEVSGKKEKGHFKVFIGYAPGVGKTFSMLNEGNRRLKHGEDVVIGYVESYGRPETEGEIGNLEIIPRQKIMYSKVEMEEMDTTAIIARKPHAVLIDEIAHTNVPGSRFKKRYEDVEEILNNGIDVVSTVNIQHIESLNDVVRHITGVKVRDTVPDYVIDEADEVEVVDLTPEALQNRLKRGNIFDLEKAPDVLDKIFSKTNLTAMREIALRHTAEEVDEELSEYLKQTGIQHNWQATEKVMVCISPSPNSKKLIRRASRIAKKYKCDWFAVSVNCTHSFAKKPSLRDRQILYSHCKLAKQLGGEIIALKGKSVSHELVRFAHERNISQIVIGNSARGRWESFFRGSTIFKLLEMSKGIEVHVIPYD